ncbi:MAG: MFS transporter [Candidatus Bathyarchaeota archaeon]|nr:MFS transporter [Candidatus Bathyarchaeota archaeon]
MQYKYVALSVTTVGAFMASLDSSCMTIGLPTVLGELNANIFHGIWIITGYRLMLTILLVMLGRIADMYGRVRLYNTGFTVFTIGSLFCALSGSGEQLILARFLQGSGAALLMANSAAIVTDAFPRNELGMGLGTNMMATNLGSMVGYTLSGVMISSFGWRSMFLINLPIGVFGTIWAYKRLKEVGVKSIGEKFDYLGSILYCAALATILYALTIGSIFTTSNQIILAAGLSLFIVFIAVERKQEYPTLDLSLFKIRLFAAGNLASFLNSLAFNCAPFIISLYLQLVKAYTPSEAGLVLIPMEIVVLTMNTITGRLADKYGSRGFATLGLILNSIALFWFSTINKDTSYNAILFGLVLFGLGRSLFSSPNSSSVMGSVPSHRRGVANGVRTTLTQTGNVMSIPVSLLLMTFIMPYDRLSQIVGTSQVIGSIELDTFLRAINFAFLILGIIVGLAIIPSLMRGSGTQDEKAKE